MAFTEECKKQRLNLSAAAAEVVKNDMFAFGEEKYSTFINRVFRNYRDDADASIALRLDAYRETISAILCGEKDVNAWKRMTEKLVAAERKRLIKKSGAYDKGESSVFWIDTENFGYLTGECCEEKYYPYQDGARPKKGLYIKSVIEEYARLPFIKRGEIFFAETVKEIKSAINGKRQLLIKDDRGELYDVSPYKILSDPLATANYLVGYSSRRDTKEPEETEERRPCSFRIAAVKSAKIEKSKSASLGRDAKRELEEKIASRGVQFMIGEEDEITVRLTEEGVRKYKRLVHLRPQFIQEERDGVYSFKCTETQVKFYFFKFGKDAEIISPETLRKKFLDMYKEAAEVYEHAQAKGV